MKTSLRSLALLFLPALLAACAVMDAGGVNNTEALLASSAFKPFVADTPARKQWLDSLPAYQLKMIQRGDKVIYVYAMPDKNMVYVGGPNEYALYQTARTQQDIAGQDRMAAEAQLIDNVDFDAVDGWIDPSAFY